MATTDQERLRLQQQQARSVPQRVVPPTVSQQALTSVPQRVPAVSPITTQGPALQSVPGQSPVFTQGRPAVSVPQRAPVSAPQGIGAFNNMPSQAEALRTGTNPLQSPPARVPVSPLPNPVNTATTGDATARIGQRLANISGEPYRDPRSVFNRPINMKPAADMAGKVADKVGSAAKTAGKALLPSAKTLTRAGIGLGGLVEASRTGFDMLTPGMTDLDKTARVAEGAGRFGLATAGGLKGAAAGGALGAMTGPLAPVLAPAGAVVGGIAGGLAGAYAPEMLNSAVNKVSGLFGGPGDNQLASQKAADLRAKNGMPPPPGQGQPKPASAALPATGAGAGRGSVNPAVVTPDPEVVASAQGAGPSASRGGARTGTPKTAKPATTATPATPQAAPQGIGANPMEGVAFTSFGDNYLGGQGRAYMADGRVVDGPEAMKIINDSNAYFAANPQAQEPVEIIRGSPIGPNGEILGDLTRNTATPELGYTEVGTDKYTALQANGGIGRLTEAIAQGTVDANAPDEAKIRGNREVQILQNQGSATNAAISAGPGYARVGEDRRQFNQTRDDGIKGIGAKSDPNNVIVVPGGQEVVDVGGFPTTITRPSRVLDKRTLKYIDGESGMGDVGNSIETDKRAAAIKNDKNMTRDQKAAALKALGY